ncbi:flagellar biosynthesis anti-sigma factor FlgM [Moorella sulfitireducens (nom. illeg.)]|uniref:flagellar biosynthesis anti-sigma factor FlgM n=1 Tax=Neomoorella sulfitireducens TaxID=2972948 RepID=UPI0021AC8529|nr:flagellar biosynthesis anti-sigma factor FlgM [Moorella sulfitireducens]
MKITGQGPVSWNRVNVAYQQGAGVQDSERPARARQEGDSVQLSPESRLIKELRTRLAGMEETSAGRVEVIRDAVAAGVYKVPEEDVAGAILKEMGR